MRGVFTNPSSWPWRGGPIASGTILNLGSSFRVGILVFFGSMFNPRQKAEVSRWTCDSRDLCELRGVLEGVRGSDQNLQSLVRIHLEGRVYHGCQPLTCWDVVLRFWPCNVEGSHLRQASEIEGPHGSSRSSIQSKQAKLPEAFQ